MNTELRDWQERLSAHFGALRRRRQADGVTWPIYALEHGLDSTEVEQLEVAIRRDIAYHPPWRNHPLPWIVYASEVGYRYSGDEYWQTFEEETPGWIQNGDRHRIREFYRLFHRDYGGAIPSGAWAEHFSIICWPITHAILPKDLQRQLARTLYDLRHTFTGDVLGSTELLGKLIGASSWNASARFQNFAQDLQLVGQVSSALLFQGDTASNELIHPSTLERISRDLDAERQARDWLRTARRTANERVQVRGLGYFRRRATPHSISQLSEARTEVETLGIEPRIVLRPTDSSGKRWEVFLEVPNLSHLPIQFPQTREILANSRCKVAGTSGRPLARGRLLYGDQRVKLVRWPKPNEVLIQFENSDAQLDYLLRTECLLRPGKKWLFRVASDGLAYERRGLRVRPGEEYIVVSTSALVGSDGHTNPIDLTCKGVQASSIKLPAALTDSWHEALQQLGLEQARTLLVWPAGLSAVEWDGEGHGEWLASDRPRLGIQADYPLESVSIALDGAAKDDLRISDLQPGQPVFIELPALSVGVHRLNFRIQSRLAENTRDIDDLQAVIRVRADHPRSSLIDHRGPLSVEVDPTLPTLEQLWEGAASFVLRGPIGREVGVRVSFFARDAETAFYKKQLPPLSLPVTSEEWTSHFGDYVKCETIAQESYDRADSCSIHFSAEELGAFTLRCERTLTPLRWALRRDDEGQLLQLYDDTGLPGQPCVSRSTFESPCMEAFLGSGPNYQVPSSGGLYTARIGGYSASIIVPPESQAVGLARPEQLPEIERLERSLECVAEIIGIAGQWGKARLSGGSLSPALQRNALQLLTCELFRLICGEDWARAEESFSFSGDPGVRSAMAEAISRIPRDRDAIAALADVVEVVASTRPSYRVRRLALLATRHRLLPENADSQDSEMSITPYELSELALRLASDPANVETWAGQELLPRLRLLLKTPSLARAARFLVLTTERLYPPRSLSDHLYAGWGWA